MAVWRSNTLFSFFDNCPVFAIPGRLFDVGIKYYEEDLNTTALNKSTYLAKALETILEIHCKEEPGDILVFLTGQQEIENACRALERMNDDLNYDRFRPSIAIARISEVLQRRQMRGD